MQSRRAKRYVIDGGQHNFTHWRYLMPWTEAQAARLLDAYWANLPQECPQCKGPVRVFESKTTGNYYVRLECSPHGKADFKRHNDPHRDNFKDWTPEQARKVFLAYYSGEATSCPNGCGTTLDIQNNVANTGDRLTAYCGRCGKHATHDDSQGSLA